VDVTRIEVLIDELVLHGFDAHERHALGDAFRAELVRLLAIDAAGRDHPRAADVERVVAPGVRLARDGAGAAVAGAVRAAIRTAAVAQRGAR
jgi:hypothetical protein